MDVFFQLFLFLLLLILGYAIGSYLEKRHYKTIKQREHETLHVPIITFGAKQAMPNAEEAQLFVGTVVISVDYFKRFSAGLRNLVGGRITVYETLLDRGRREALLRMKIEAIEWGADKVMNVRIETATIGGRSGGNNSLGSIEVIAYGTGIKSS
jgi:uncharacterized protein YbjQ (UPF0145 family)